MYNVLPNITYRGVFRYRRAEETPAALKTYAAGEIQTVEAPSPRGGRVGRLRAVCRTRWIRSTGRPAAEAASQSRTTTPKPLIWRIIGSKEIFRFRYVHWPRQTALIYQRENAL